MKFVTLLVALLIVTSTAEGQQTNAKQLIQNIDHASSDTDKLTAYRAIANYYQVTQPDSAYYYINQGMRYFTERDYILGQATMHGLLGITYSIQSMMDAAKKEQLEGLKLFTLLKDTNGIAATNNALGVIEGKTGHYTKATEYFLTALRLFEKKHSDHGIIATYMKLGIVNDLVGNYDKAIDYYTKALDISPKNKTEVNTINLYNNMGNVYGRIGKYEEAKIYFKKALDQASPEQFEQDRVASLTNLANAYILTNDNNSAMEYLNMALPLTLKYKVPEDYTRVMLIMASITSQTNPHIALDTLKSVFNATRQMQQRQLQTEVMQAMVDIYEQLGNYKDAYTLLKEEHKLKDSIYNIEKEKQIASLQAMHDLEQSNEKLQEMSVTEQKNKRTRNVIIVIAISLGTALLALAYSFTKSNKLNKKLAKREAELARANADKDRLFSIIGHDLRGPINNIPLAIEMHNSENTTKEEKAFLLSSLHENAVATVETLEKLLNWGKAQIKGISLNQTKFAANDSLKVNIALLKGAADNKLIEIENHVPADLKVYADEEHFRFVSRNLLANAIKFTSAGGKIELAADTITKKGFVVFSVKDNGIGMDKEQQEHIFDTLGVSTAGTANERGHSIGLMLCKEFINENGGDIWVESEKGKGSTFYFSMKAGS